MKGSKNPKNIKKYSHISKAERLEIYILLNKKYSFSDIAKALKRSKNSISYEIKNNSVKGIYEPIKAQHKAYVKRWLSKFRNMKIIDNKELWDYIEEKLKKWDWSPEQISGRIKHIDKHITNINFKSIYKFIKSRHLEKYLRFKGKKRRENDKRKSKLKDRVFIDKRPKIIDIRGRFGDWEGDLIVSGKNGKGCLLVLFERKGRFVIIRKIMSKKTRIINKHFSEMTGGLLCLNSFTLDNDISFQKHKELSKSLNIPVYFCNPYHSWEKGGVENVNQLIRQYIPKRSDISKISKSFIRLIEFKLNNRPRKCLNYKTPLEVMLENNLLKNSYLDIYNLPDILSFKLKNTHLGIGRSKISSS